MEQTKQKGCRGLNEMYLFSKRDNGFEYGFMLFSSLYDADAYCQALGLHQNGDEEDDRVIYINPHPYAEKELNFRCACVRKLPVETNRGA